MVYGRKLRDGVSREAAQKHRERHCLQRHHESRHCGCGRATLAQVTVEEESGGSGVEGERSGEEEGG